MKISSDGTIASCPCDSENLLRIGHIYDNYESLSKLYNGKMAQDLRKKMIFSNAKDAYCQFCEFRRSTTLREYLMPIKNTFTPDDVYNHKLEKQYNSDETIKDKLEKLNVAFPDNQEDKWISILNDIKSSFYKTKV